jgi:hypothetical protein
VLLTFAEEMPIETTIEKARLAMDSGNLHRAKEILRSSFGNYGFSPPLFRAYADVLLALKETTQAGRYLFFSIDQLDEQYQDAVSAFLSAHSGEGYKSIVRASPAVRISRLSELPPFSQQKLRELGAPEDLSRLYSDQSSWWVIGGCLTVIIALVSLAAIGMWTVFRWIIE